MAEYDSLLPPLPPGTRLLETKDNKKLNKAFFRDNVDLGLRGASFLCACGSGAALAIYFHRFPSLVNYVMVKEFGKAVGVCLEVVVYACLFGACSGLMIGCSEVSVERRARAIRTGFFEEIMRQDTEFFDACDCTALGARLEYNVECFKAAEGKEKGRVWYYALLAVALVVQNVYRNPSRTSLSCISLPVVLAAGIIAARTDATTSRRCQEAFAEGSSVLLETVTAIRTIKALCVEPVMKDRFRKAVDKARQVAVKGSLLSGIAEGVQWFGIFAAALIAFGIALQAMLDSPNTRESNATDWYEVILAFVMAVTVTIAGFLLGKMGPSLVKVSKGKSAVKDILYLFTRPSKVETHVRGDSTAGPRITQGEIEFRNVSFEYTTRPGYPVFSNISFKIPAGKRVAIVGASGSGKSTIVALLERFYDVTSGEILIDGVNIRDYDLHYLRSQIGLVSQEPRLFSTSIEENIRAGSKTEGMQPDEIAAAITEASREANAHDFIDAFPNKYQTWVGEAGSQLSGGQKQRIVIARALMRKPRILLLDEATSALDNKSEAIVQNTLETILTGDEASPERMTCIIVAHRLSSIRNADLIIALSNITNTGAVVKEMGTHDQLIGMEGGLYRSLVEIQVKALEPASADSADVALLKKQESQEITESVRAEKYLKSTSKVFPSKLEKTSSMNISRQLSKQVSLRSNNANSSQQSVHSPHYGTRSMVAELDPVPESPDDVEVRRAYRRVLKSLKAEWWRVVIAILSSVGVGIQWTAFLLFVGERVSSFKTLQSDEFYRDYRTTFLVMFCLFPFIFGLACNFLNKTFITQCGEMAISNIRVLAFESLLKKNMSFFDRPEFSVGQLLQTLSSEVLYLKSWTGENAGIYTATTIGLVTGVAVALIIQRTWGLWFLGTTALYIPLAGLNAWLMNPRRYAKKQVAQRVRADGTVEPELDTILNETIVNIRTVRAYNLETSQMTVFAEVVQQEFRRGLWRAVFTGTAWGLSTILMLVIFTLNTGIVIIYFERHPLLELRDIGRGALSMVLLTIAMLNFGRAFGAIGDSFRARLAANKIFKIVDHRIEFDEFDEKEGQELLAIDTITFDHVAFRYPTRMNQPVFKSVSFEIKKGQTVAIVGTSGSGKTTTLQLLERFYDTCGIKINDVDIRNYTVPSIRRMVGLVSQEPTLFYGSIEMNVAMGASLSAEKIKQSLDLANASEFVDKLPARLGTEVGRGGSALSGGQKQRIAIARTLSRSPHLLLLDEATSALDALSEKVVQDTISQLTATRSFTTIIVAHRLSTIRNADVIIVLLNDRGTGSFVAEIGSHDELVQIPSGIYRSLYNVGTAA